MLNKLSRILSNKYKIKLNTIIRSDKQMTQADKTIDKTRSQYHLCLQLEKTYQILQQISQVPFFCFLEIKWKTFFMPMLDLSDLMQPYDSMGYRRLCFNYFFYPPSIAYVNHDYHRKLLRLQIFFIFVLLQIEFVLCTSYSHYMIKT